jgi:hypothetical protein
MKGNFLSLYIDYKIAAISRKSISGSTYGNTPTILGISNFHVMSHSTLVTVTTRSMMSALIPMSSPLRPDPHTPPRRRLYKNRDFSSPSSAPDHPRKAFLRERFKQRCFERAQHAREKQVKRSRWSAGNAPSSDDFDHEMDDEEHEDSVINDEASVPTKRVYVRD